MVFSNYFRNISQKIRRKNEIYAFFRPDYCFFALLYV